MKNSCQKYIWAEEAGLKTEYILCSGDPDSLDGLILPGKAVAIVDGTAPHIQEELAEREHSEDQVGLLERAQELLKLETVPRELASRRVSFWGWRSLGSNW